MAQQSRLSVVSVLLCAVVLASSSVGTQSAAARPAGQSAVSGFRTLSGPAARDFRPPSDVKPLASFELKPLGITLTRYQQYVTGHGAAVDGGQLTVLTRARQAVLVVGAHYPNLSPRNRRALDDTQAIAHAIAHAPALAPHRGRATHQRSALLIDPHTGRLFYRVESAGLDVRRFHDVDAESGAILDEYDALGHDHGSGVKGDRKSLVGGPGTADDLTRRTSGAWRMRSVDDRLVTYDMAKTWSGALIVAADDDNHWTAKGQRAAVDAHYYARATDDFLRNRFGFDVLAPACGYGRIQSVVRFGKKYANAFWNGRQLVYGNGDGVTFRPLSGAHDVVAHELTHAVTECTSALVYWNEPGALNEAFSDILATIAEFELAEPLNSNCRRAAGQSTCADWWIGEDVWLGGGGLGLRSLADPGAGRQPAHYSARYTGAGDNGGVHINSGIPGHAFYLLSEGGRNARCAGPDDLRADCDVVVSGIGLADARDIAFVTYAGLPSTAGFCDARSATIATAEALFPGSLAHAAAATLAWAAVGLGEGQCGGSAAYTVELETRGAYVAPGGAREVELTLAGDAPSTAELALDGLPGAWYTLTSDMLTLTIPTDATAGSHPFRLRASSAKGPAQAYGVIVVDATPPVVAVPSVSLAKGMTVPASGGLLPVSVMWTATDTGSGVAVAKLELSTDGGTWQDITPPAGPGTPTIVKLGPGAHRFRASATDGVGNAAASAASVAVTVAGLQETAASYSAGWSTLATDLKWGSTRTTSETKRKATLTFSGTDIGWVAQRGPKQGKAKVFVDGVLVGRVDLYAATNQPRQVVFSAAGLAAGTHTLRIVSLGTSGRPRVNIDGFLVISR